MHRSTLAKRGTVFLFLVLIVFYLYGLGHFPLLGPDEPRYAQVAREMLLGHDLITPTLGGHTWFEKPALLYWMMIVSFKLFGVSEWSARLPGALSGILTVLGVFIVGRRVSNSGSEVDPHEYGFCSTLAAATTLGIVVFSRAASFDIVLTMTTTWALSFYLLHECEHKKQLRIAYLVGFYAFVGLSLLAKGLLGIVIPAGVVGLYYVFCRSRPRGATLVSLLWGTPLALLISATWYAPVIARNGWPFIDQFFIQHHFARYVSDKYHHSEPFYYYLLVVPLLALPWTSFLVDGLLQFKSWLRRVSSGTTNESGDCLPKILIFAFAWFLFPLVFFSFSGSKLPGYILPMLPAAALIVGERLWRFSSEAKVRRAAIRTTAILYLIFSIGVLAYQRRTGAVPFSSALVIVAPLLVAGIFSLLMPRLRNASVLLLGGATMAVVVLALNFLGPAAADFESSKRLLQLADARGYSRAAIFGMQRSDRTPEFYAAGRVVYGADGEPIMYEGPGQLVEECARRKDPVLVFVPIGEVSQLTGTPRLHTEVIGNNARYAIVAVRLG